MLYVNWTPESHANPTPVLSLFAMYCSKMKYIKLLCFCILLPLPNDNECSFHLCPLTVL